MQNSNNSNNSDPDADANEASTRLGLANTKTNPNSIQEKGEFVRTVVFLLASALLVALVFWPFTMAWITQQWDIRNAPDVVTSAGMVQRINFVGSFSGRTQIDTETEVLLVSGYVTLSKGTPLEYRQDYYEKRVCVAGTLNCGKVLNR